MEPGAHALVVGSGPIDALTIWADGKMLIIELGLWFQSMFDVFFSNRLQQGIAGQTTGEEGKRRLEAEKVDHLQ